MCVCLAIVKPVLRMWCVLICEREHLPLLKCGSSTHIHSTTEVLCGVYLFPSDTDSTLLLVPPLLLPKCLADGDSRTMLLSGMCHLVKDIVHSHSVTDTFDRKRVETLSTLQSLQ